MRTTSTMLVLVIMITACGGCTTDEPGDSNVATTSVSGTTSRGLTAMRVLPRAARRPQGSKAEAV